MKWQDLWKREIIDVEARFIGRTITGVEHVSAEGDRGDPYGNDHMVFHLDDGPVTLVSAGYDGSTISGYDGEADE